MSQESMTTSIFNLLLKREKEDANTVYLRQPRNGVWTDYTWSEVVLAARKVAAYLQQLGLKRGSHIGIISKNCAEWVITDFGITLAGMVCVPLYSNQHKESIHFVLEHSDTKLVFIGKLDDHQKVRGYIPKEYPTISFDYHANLQVDHSWQQVMEAQPLAELIEPQPDDLYTLVYTSGTTGHPKGAMFEHKTIANFLSLVATDIHSLIDLPHYHVPSYLPLAHIYERANIELTSLALPMKISFIESLERFASNLQEIQPNMFTAVPRIWGVFQQKIEQKMSQEQIKLLMKVPFVNKQVRKKILDRLGLEKCVRFVSGASKLPTSMIEFFDLLELTILEGYGQTENLAYASVSHEDDRKIGYVGKPRFGVEVKIGGESEVLLKSPCLMSGYYKDSKSTKAAFTSDGWLHTGDIGELDAEGRIKISGRLCETYKNQTGEFVSPSPIEEQLAANPYIEQLCLIGSGLPGNVLLVTLNSEACLDKNKSLIEESLMNQLQIVNNKLLKFEKVSHVIITKDSWSTDNNLLTPTLKVRRKQVEAQYAEFVSNAIKVNQRIIWE